MKKSFAKGNNFYKLFWIFFIGCFLGVVIETIWCLIKLGHFESRQGLVYGPFNLVYGLGAVAMTLVFSRMRKTNFLIVFFLGALLGGVYEYVCSMVQQALTGTVSWDYGEYAVNLNGRISLLYCIFWGILAVLWCKVLYPFISTLIEKIPNKIGIILTWVLLVFMIFNSVISTMAVYRMKNRSKNIPPSNKIEQLLDERFNDERMKRIYPNMMIK